uniref:Uncharacterized protein n=1 Tax=Cacopsylla melanoneura TaxID=428564 RepID=A0A8D8ZJR7_9HEMI
MSKKDRQSHIYDDYLRDQFTPFVSQQLNTIWIPEHFDRIQHVLSFDNYYRQTDPHAAANRPKSRSTRHILLWLNEQSKLKQVIAHRQPISTTVMQPVINTTRQPSTTTNTRQPLINTARQPSTTTRQPVITPSSKFAKSNASQFPQVRDKHVFL